MVALAAVSCVKEQMTIFDASKATAPVLAEYQVTDDGVSAVFTPGSANQNFNTQMPLNHWLVLTSLNGNPMNQHLNTSVKGNIISISTTNLSKALMAMGFEEGEIVSLEMVIRASTQEPSKDNGINGFVDSQGKISIPAYEVYLPTGDPYARYTEKSPWGLVGSFNGWGSDPDLEMWTNGTLHVVKAARLSAGDEVKFRMDSSWDVNLGYAEGVTSYTKGEEFALSAGGANIVIAEDGVYDLIIDPESKTAKIIDSVAEQTDPYADYKEVSPWSVIGSFNSWAGDVEMVTNGTLHVCKNITLEAGTEWKFRKDGSWDVNFGYAEGVTSYTLGEEFALGAGGANIIIEETGAYDFILDPENATAKIIKTQAVVIDPYASYKEDSPWSVIGSFNSWGDDVPMVTNGTLHVAKAIALNAGTEWKFRKDKSWDVNFGYAEGVSSYTLGEEFAVAGNGANIILAEDGVYDFILDPENATAKIIVSIAVDQPEPPAPEDEPKVWSLIGTLGGSSWDKDYDMSLFEGTTWLIRNVAVTASDEFKIRADHDWAKSYGGPEENSTSTIDPTNPYGVYKPELGKSFEAKDKNIQIGVAGNYDVYFDTAEKSIWIVEHVSYYSLIGAVNGSNWDKDILMRPKASDEKVWMSDVVTINGEFKIRYDFSWADENTFGLAEEGTTKVGEAFTLVQPGKNMSLAEGQYRVELTPETKTVLITEVKYPENLYMIGEEFGGWNWGSDGVVQMTPVLHNPAWGADAEGQFYTVRYFTAGKGFKFCSVRDWKGDFYSLGNDDGYTVDGGNCTVAADGFYLVHINFKYSQVHVEPAKVYGIGEAFGGWDKAVEANLFKAEGKTLTATVPKAGNLRMYVSSDIATSDWWTREFNIIDGVITPRIMDELPGVPVLADQTVVLDFNAGTGEIKGEGAAPAYKTEISVPGAYSGSEWDLEKAPKLLGKADGVFKGALVMYKPAEAESVEFKFGHDGSWIGGAPVEGESYSYTLGADSNLKVADGVYFWTVNLEAKTAVALPITKVALIGSFNNWGEDLEMTYNAEDNTYNVSVTLADNAEFKVRFNGNWDYCLGGALDKLSALEGNIKVTEGGAYTAKLNLNKGTLTLTK